MTEKYLIDKLIDRIKTCQTRWHSSPSEIWVTPEGYKALCQQTLAIMSLAANAEARRGGEYWSTKVSGDIEVDTLYGLKIHILGDDEVIVK